MKKRFCFAAVVTGSFFVLLEIALALVGLAPVTETSDPFVGFSSQVPLFVPDASSDEKASGRDFDGKLLRTAEHRLVWFNDQTFTAKKPANTLRVFCLGGSTTYGRPYDDKVSFAGWLRTLLPEVSPQQTVEVINAGGVSYASYRVANILEELTQYEPDLFVVYSAQNEFLERRTYADMFDNTGSTKIRSVLAKTRCWTLVDRIVNGGEGQTTLADDDKQVMPAEVDEMLNHTVGPSDYHFDPTWQEGVVQHYAFNLRRMVTLAEQVGAIVVFVTPGSNLRDCSPFKSEHSKPLLDAQQTAFDDLMRRARATFKKGEFESALVLLEQAERISDRFAQLHYEKGLSHFALQQYAPARKAFERALADDVCPLRAIPDIVTTLRTVAKRTSSPLVDYEAQLRDRCLARFGHACIGRELFLDHVHPNIDEHREIAMAIIETFDEIGFVRKTADLDDEQLASIADDLKATIDPYEEGVSFRNLAKVYHWAGKFAEALPMAKRALSLIEEDEASLFIAGECERLIDNNEQAIAYFDRLLLVEPFHFDAHISLGMLLSDVQEYETAALHLAFGITGISDSWYAHQEYGVALYHLNEFEKAHLELEYANELDPSNSRTLYFLAKTAEALNDTATAIELQMQLLAIQGPTADAHLELAALHRSAGQDTEAEQHAAAAARLSETPESNSPANQSATSPPNHP